MTFLGMPLRASDAAGTADLRTFFNKKRPRVADDDGGGGDEARALPRAAQQRVLEAPSALAAEDLLTDLVGAPPLPALSEAVGLNLEADVVSEDEEE
ncbi:MAG: hypothetical protein HN849_00930 [Victivallales bacterium]|nr:hypothetical protein [Victivallales bacterium]